MLQLRWQLSGVCLGRVSFCNRHSKGYDENDVICETEIKFISVIAFKQNLPRFTSELYNAYDKVVELIDSKWLKELKKIDKEEFTYWNPKHYILYLDGFGMYQFIAQSLEVEK